MSKKRAAAKYTAATAVSAVYLVGMYQHLSTPPTEGEEAVFTRRQAVTAVASLLGLTWMATVL